MNQKDIWDTRYTDNRKTLANDGWILSFMDYIDRMHGYVIVDLGCGKGDNALLLHERGHDVIACDFSSEAIGFIKEQYPFMDAQCLDMLTQFPTTLENVGMIVASLSTHYFSVEDTIKLYDNIHDLLEAGGYFILRVNSKHELEQRDRPNVIRGIEQDYYLLNDGTTKRYFDVHSLSALLDKFSILKINECGTEYNGKRKHYIEAVAQRID